MPGLLGKKIGMTSVFSADGKNIPCTVIEVGPCEARAGVLYLDLNFNAAWQLKLHECIDGLGCRAVDVDETLER